MKRKVLEIEDAWYSNGESLDVATLTNLLEKIKNDMKLKATKYHWSEVELLSSIISQISDPRNTIDKVVADTCGSNLESYKEMLEGVLKNKEPFRMHHSELEKTVDDVNRIRNKIEHLKYVTNVYKGYQKERLASMWRMKSNGKFKSLYIYSNVPDYNSPEHKERVVKLIKETTKELKDMFKLYNGYDGDITQEYKDWIERERKLEDSIVT